MGRASRAPLGLLFIVFLIAFGQLLANFRPTFGHFWVNYPGSFTERSDFFLIDTAMFFFWARNPQKCQQINFSGKKSPEVSTN